MDCANNFSGFHIDSPDRNKTIQRGIGFVGSDFTEYQDPRAGGLSSDKTELSGSNISTSNYVGRLNAQDIPLDDSLRSFLPKRGDKHVCSRFNKIRAAFKSWNVDWLARILY